MSVNVTLNGTVYPIPTQEDKKWAPPLTRYLVALAAAALTPAGGAFTLTSNVNFGPTFGLLSKYFASVSANPATSGAIRLAKTDTIDWRNNANSGENILAVNGSDQLTYNGAVLSGGFNTLADGAIWIGSVANAPVAQTLTGDVAVTDLGVTSIGALKITNAQLSNSAAIAYAKLNLTGSIVNADIYSSAAIAYSKLSLSASIANADIASAAAIAFTKLAALNPSIVPVTNGSGFITSSTTTATQLGYLDATSSIQSQINATVSVANAALPASSFTDAGVTGKLLTGYVSGAGTVAATDTILAAFDKINGNVAATVAVANAALPASSFTDAAVMAKLLVGFSSTTGALLATDTLIVGIDKLNGNLAATVSVANAALPASSFTDSAVTSKLITGYVSGAGTVGAGDTILQAIDKLNGNILAITDVDNYLPLVGGTMTGDITMSNQHAVIFKELTANGTTAVTLEAPATVTGSYTLQLPPALGSAGSVPTDVAGNGVLTMVVPTGAGTVNSGTAGQVAYYATSTTAVSGTNAFTVGSTGPNGIVVGTNTNNNAASGVVGEYITNFNSFANNFPTTANWGDGTSISLTAGDWDVSAVIYTDVKGITTTIVQFGISQATGNDATGLNLGDNLFVLALPVASAIQRASGCIAGYRQSLSGATTIYLKVNASYSGTTPQYGCRLTARRRR